MPTLFLDALQRQMEESVAADDFETASKPRDEIQGVPLDILTKRLGVRAPSAPRARCSMAPPKLTPKARPIMTQAGDLSGRGAARSCVFLLASGIQRRAFGRAGAWAQTF